MNDDFTIPWAGGEEWKGLYTSPLYGIEVPQTITVAQIESIRKRFEELNREPLTSRPMEMTYTPPGPTMAQFERLLSFLDLTDEERSFVRAALNDPENVDFFCVLADYLEEKGRMAASEKFRKLGAK